MKPHKTDELTLKTFRFAESAKSLPLQVSKNPTHADSRGASKVVEMSRQTDDIFHRDMANLREGIKQSNQLDEKQLKNQNDELKKAYDGLPQTNRQVEALVTLYEPNKIRFLRMGGIKKMVEIMERGTEVYGTARTLATVCDFQEAKQVLYQNQIVHVLQKGLFLFVCFIIYFICFDIFDIFIFIF